MKSRGVKTATFATLLLLNGCLIYPYERPSFVFETDPPPIIIFRGAPLIVTPPPAQTHAYPDPSRGRIRNESRSLTYQCWLDPTFQGARPQDNPTLVLKPFDQRELFLQPGPHGLYCQSTYATAHFGPQPGPVIRNLTIPVGPREYLLYGLYGWEVILTGQGGYDP